MWNRINGTPDIQEISTSRHRIGQRAFPIRVDNFELVAMAWSSGMPIELVAFLVFRGASAERKRIQHWLDESYNEPTPIPAFEDDIEQVAAFCNEYIGAQWSWVFRGASTIAEYLNLAKIASKANELASRLEHGVKYLASAELLRHNCPIDRAKLDWLIGSFFPSATVESEALDGGRFLEWLTTGEPQLVGKSITPFSRIRITAEDIVELKGFLQAENQR